jgi:hypothetical protein
MLNVAIEITGYKCCTIGRQPAYVTRMSLSDLKTGETADPVGDVEPAV